MDNLFRGIVNAIRDVVTLGGRLSESSEELFDNFEERIREEFGDFENKVREWIKEEFAERKANANTTPRKSEVKK